MPTVGGAESCSPALSPRSLLCIPQNPSGVSGRREVPRGGEESGRQRSLLCTSCVSCGQGCARSLPPALTNCPLTTLSPGWWGCGCWGFFSSLEPSPRPDVSPKEYRGLNIWTRWRIKGRPYPSTPIRDCSSFLL